MTTPLRRLGAIASHLPAAAESAQPPQVKVSSRGGMAPRVNKRGPKTEAEVRIELAAAYRFIDHVGWGDGINNHITASIPGRPDEYLINSYGMGFDEVTASSLVKIDVDGNVLDPGSVGGHVNLAGFNIHGAIHRADPAAACVVHTHEVHCAAVASMECGFLPGLSQHSLLCGAVARHPYAPTTGRGGTAECDQMAADLINTANARIMLLENHGKLRTMCPYYSYAQLAVSLGTCIPAESWGCHHCRCGFCGCRRRHSGRKHS